MHALIRPVPAGTGTPGETEEGVKPARNSASSSATRDLAPRRPHNPMNATSLTADHRVASSCTSAGRLGRVVASDDNQRLHGARPTTASPRRTTRRPASTPTPGRRRYRSRRTSSGHRCVRCLLRRARRLPEQAVDRGGASSKHQSAATFDAAAPGRSQGRPHRSAGRLLRSQTDSDLGPGTGTARDCLRTNPVTPAPALGAPESRQSPIAGSRERLRRGRATYAALPAYTG